MEDPQKYIVNDIKTSRAWDGRWKKKTREELEIADDQEELVITPLAGRKGRGLPSKKERKKKKARGAQDDDQEAAGEEQALDNQAEEAAGSDFGSGGSRAAGEEAESDTESSTNHITFHNTSNYGRHCKDRADLEDPIVKKYTKGAGSVKGLHYMRYIALELLSEYTFTLSFHKFYSQEVKNLIKNIEKSRFDPELRKWTLSVQAYDLIMAELKKICSANQIHIEDIPQFTINLMKTKVPYSMSPQAYYGGLQSRYDYSSDKTIHMELEEFCPPLIIKSMLLFQKENVM